MALHVAAIRNEKVWDSYTLLKGVEALGRAHRESRRACREIRG